MSNALREHTPHESRAISTYKGYGTRTFPFDLCWKDGHQKTECLRVINQADLYVLHSYFSLQRNQWRIETRLRPQTKVTAHYCVRPDRACTHLADEGVPTTVSAQYHARFFRKSKPMPNIMPIREALYTPKERAWPPDVPLRIAYSPSNQLGQGQAAHDPWSWKGYEPTVRVLRALKQKFGGKIDFRVIENVPLQRCLALRAECHISIDECVTGSYHNVHLEGMSQGLLSAVYMDQETLKAVEAVAGPKAVQEPPWLNVGIEDLGKAIETFVGGSGGLRERAGACRRWMETYWDDRVLAKLYADFYEKLPPYQQIKGGVQ